MNSEVEPPWKKQKTNLPAPAPPLPSFLSLPDEIVLHCLARISKSYYPKLSQVSKTFRSLIYSIELNHARFHHKTQQAFFHVCLQFPDHPLPSWFTLWIKPDQIETNEKRTKKKKTKKKMSTLVKVPSSYASREPLFLASVGSDIYALRQSYPPSPVMLVRNKDVSLWRETPNMNVARANAAACVLDGKVYVMGGCSADESTNWAEVFDTKTQTWEPLPNPGKQLRFSSMIRKIELIKGMFYIRSNEKKDSVYDPKKGRWSVAAKPLVRESRCWVNNVWYSCRPESCLWYDTECKDWRVVKGLSSLNKSLRRGLIESVNYGGKLLILWDKFAQRGHSCQDKNICCALIALEKRKCGHVWGKIEWTDVVLTVPSSYVFLRSIAILV